jgi:glycine/D-amino acid oxidase-like deaminating enzyme
MTIRKVSWAKKDKVIYPSLKKDVEADVVIVGGGLAGVVAAYLLSLEKKKVVLVEKNKLGSGATHDTTAFITQEIDTNLADLQDLYGLEKTKKVWESGAAAIELIENIVKEEKIDCGFMRCSAYVYARKAEELEEFKKDQKVAKKIGFETHIKTDDKLGFKNAGYWEISNQAKFEPMKYLYALAEKAVKKGAKIYEKTEALELSDDHPFKVETREATIIADHFISATYRPFDDNGKLFGKKGMYKSYVLAANIAKNKIPEGIYWDRHNPYHYFRVDSMKDHDRLILGGADHREELPMSEEKNFKALESYLDELLEGIDYTVERKWAGPILEPSDGLALIGKIDENKYLASAFSGNGMTYSHISGMIFSDLIYGRQNEWIEVYDPLRSIPPKVMVRKAMDYTQEFFGGAVKNFLRQ